MASLTVSQRSVYYVNWNIKIHIEKTDTAWVNYVCLAVVSYSIKNVEKV